MDIGMGEILLILLFALLVYGGRLPEVARSLGRSLAEVKRGLSETTKSVQKQIDAVQTSVEVPAEEEERPRTVRRVQPASAEAPSPAAAAVADAATATARGRAPNELATEDVSGGGDATPAGDTPKPGADAPPAG